MNCNLNLCISEWLKEYPFEIYDINGEEVPIKKDGCFVDVASKRLKISLDDDVVRFTDREHELIRCLLEEAIMNGGYTELMREYLKLLDKLEKKFEKLL